MRINYLYTAMAMRIFLAGFMGSGKTTAGRLLSDRLGYAFIDLDQKIENDTRSTITEIFNTSGEVEFRELERIALHQTIAENSDVIVATGGGTPCFYDNMPTMNRHGITIYLQLSHNLLYNRLLNAPSRINRPLFSQLDPSELRHAIAKQLAIREPFYLQANIILNCDLLTAESICEKILALLQRGKYY